MSDLFKVFINCSRLRNSGTHSFSPMFPHSPFRSPHEFLLIILVPLGSSIHVNSWTVLLVLDSSVPGLAGLPVLPVRSLLDGCVI